MRHDANPAEFDLVLVGGGHSHLAVLRRFAMAPMRGVRLTLVARELHTPYSGMLPGLLAGHYQFDDAHVDLGPLAAAAGARLIHAPLTGLDAEQQLLHLPDRPPLHFDALSLNTGAEPSLQGVAGDVEALLRVKPISRLLPRFESLLARLGRDSGPHHLAVVGGGAGGVELVLALARRLRKEGAGDTVSLHLLTAAARLLPGHSVRVARRLQDALADVGVQVHFNARVSAVTTDGLQTEAGTRLHVDEVLWATGAAAPAWLRRSGLELDDDGFVAVGPTLQSRSHPAVFAAGDVAALSHAARPKSGVFAVRAGPVLADNLRAWIGGGSLRPFRPQRRALYLISTGDRRAVVARPGWPVLAGNWVWRWKDWIDRRFMAQYQRIEPMVPDTPVSDVATERGGQRLAGGMRCAGCGSKLGTGTLLQGLTTLGRGRGAFEDAASWSVAGRLLYQTIDGFALPVSDPFLGGRLAALHAMGDLHAMGSRPLAALALAGVPYAGPRQMAQDLAQMMAGATLELERSGCQLLGGHSSESPTLSLGLALTGDEVPADVAGSFAKSGLQAGQLLVLTRPLGSGVLLAGAAAGLVPSSAVASALEAMLQPHDATVEILRAYRASACTDVTGFGLLGHALEMALASGCRVRLELDAVPAFAGAEAALADGLRSSLQADNEAALARCRLGAGVVADLPRLQLLSDPQTCGGLLAAVPAAQADACINALRQQGNRQATVVGTVLPAVAAEDDSLIELCRPPQA